MAFGNIDSQNLGKYLQIAFSEGIRSQISADFRDFEYVSRNRVADPAGREIRFFIQKSYGPSAIQYRNPTVTSAFPSSQQVSTQENTAVFKEIDATIEIEYNVWKRAQLSGNVRYAEPLAVEIESKLTALKRQVAKDLYADGTGVLGTLSATTPVFEGDNIRFELSTAVNANGDQARGHVGFFEFDEILTLRDNDGSRMNTTFAGTEPTYFKVISRRRSDNTVLCAGLDASLATLTAATMGAIGGTATDDVFFKYEQPTGGGSSLVGGGLDLTASIADYGSITEVIPGFQSLAANDGRVIHGLTMSGSTAATHYDAGNVQIDVSHIEAVMNEAKINTGASAYAWKMMCSTPETYSAFVEGRETDRRFNSIEDTTRGVRVWKYQHREDSMELHASEYCPKKEIYVLPEAKQGQGKVIEWHGTDFMPVQGEGMNKFHLKPSSSGGHQRVMSSYLEGYGTLICKHPAAMAKIKNFLTD